jgi:biofilm PGA synthesis lipoprotein PgaB
MSRDWPLILAYHHIVPVSVRSRYDVTVGEFERRLGSMLSSGFSPVTIAEAIEIGAAGTASPKTFTVTFDDGFRSFAELAFPAIDRLGLTAATTAFVPTAYVGARNGWVEPPTPMERVMRRADASEALMSWDEIGDLRRAGVSFHSHGHAHLAMHSLSYEEARADLDASRTQFAERGIDARYLALPYGWQSDTLKRAIRDAGFDAAFAVERGGRDRLDIRRIPMYGTDIAAVVDLKLSGRYFGWYDTAARLAGTGDRG